MSLINFNYPDHTNKAPNSRRYQTIYITSVIEDKSKYDKIKRKFAERRSESIYDRTYEYDEEFWDHYNLIELPPIDSIVVFYSKRLELLKNEIK